jgi:ubiquinone/menaquinone biosynthesis C-methylase UbiE
MNPKELAEWYSIKEYDPEGKELNAILKLGNLKGKGLVKDILLIGTYGALSVSFKLKRYAESLTAIDSNKKLIDYCRKKIKGVTFKHGNLSSLRFSDKTFDAVISLWAGLHYLKNKKSVIKELRRILKDNGILLIEEADETSEYVRILDKIAPKRKSKIKKRRNELKQILKIYFNLKEKKLTTFYHFRNAKQFKGYFEKEIVFDENRKFTRTMEKKLEDYLSKKKSLKVEEKSIFFICKKK